MAKVPIPAGITKPILVPKGVLCNVDIYTTDGHSGKLGIEGFGSQYPYSGTCTNYQLTFSTTTDNFLNDAASGTTDIEVEVTQV